MKGSYENFIFKMGQIDKGIANYFYSCIPHTGGSRPSYKGGGQSSRPLVKGGEAGLEKILFRPFGPQLVWSKNKGGAPSWIRLCTMQDVMHRRCIYSLFPSTAVLHIHFYGTRLRSKRSSLSSGETSTSVTSSKSCFAFSSPC